MAPRGVLVPIVRRWLVNNHFSTFPESASATKGHTNWIRHLFPCVVTDGYDPTADATGSHGPVSYAEGARRMIDP